MMTKSQFTGYKQKDIFTKAGKMYKKWKFNFPHSDCGPTWTNRRKKKQIISKIRPERHFRPPNPCWYCAPQLQADVPYEGSWSSRVIWLTVRPLPTLWAPPLTHIWLSHNCHHTQQGMNSAEEWVFLIPETRFQRVREKKLLQPWLSTPNEKQAIELKQRMSGI